MEDKVVTSKLAKLIKKKDINKNVFDRYINFCIDTNTNTNMRVEITPGIDSKKRFNFTKKQVNKWVKEIKAQKK